MSEYRAQVAGALGALTVRSPTRYVWLGRPSRPLSRWLDAELDDAGRRDYLVSCLREELYCSFYCRGRPEPARWGEDEPRSPDHRLLNDLAEVNAGRGTWEPGWTVRRHDGDQALVARARLRARVPLTECRPDREGTDVGATVRVRLPKELPELSPGFVVIVGDAAVEPSNRLGVVRVYWNVARSGAPTLVGALTARLNAEGAPFRLKVANHAFRMDRCDSAVLYVPGAVFRSLEGTLRDIAVQRRALLLPRIPAFTLELAPGVGLAEDNNHLESFGFRRCTWLADAIVRVHEHGIESTNEQIAAVAERFEEAGVELDRPYLEPSLADRHVL